MEEVNNQVKSYKYLQAWRKTALDKIFYISKKIKIIKQLIKALKEHYQKILNRKKQNLIKLEIDKVLIDISNNLALFNLFFLIIKEVLDTDNKSNLAS